MHLHPCLNIGTGFVTEIYCIGTRYDPHSPRQQFYLGNYKDRAVGLLS